tara:strand:- start:3435 stop:4271 length:837 start_codon:yes stop_codon:yes gene_type:complete
MIQNKINYLLSRFKKVEWSGPAWYSIDKVDEDNFPVEVSLQYFKPIHLGHGTETELDGDAMGKLLPKIYKRFPDLKDCFLGLIHSHHTMGAFLSGTDKDTAKDQAVKDGIFFSTVVASSGEPFDCCLTYKDQFGFTNLVEGEVITPVIKVDIPQEWKQEATKIEKAKKKENKITYVNSGTNQISAFGGYHGGYGYGRGWGVHGQEAPEEPAKKNGNTQSLSWDRETQVSDKETEVMTELHEMFMNAEMTYHDFIEECRKKCPNIDPHSFIDALGRNFY